MVYLFIVYIKKILNEYHKIQYIHINILKVLLIMPMAILIQLLLHWHKKYSEWHNMMYNFQSLGSLIKTDPNIKL